MSRLVHLSDLHFGAHERHKATIEAGLLETLGALGGRVDALVITGDVFDSNRPASGVIDAFVQFVGRIDRVLGQVPLVLVPGNHDRRDDGVFGPWSGDLFRTLAARFAGSPHVQVLGNATPFLAARIELPGLDADVAVYDSSWLPKGLVSAGGHVRQEDLLQLASELPDSDRPLLFLLHHHLVPTPVTDTSVIATEGRPAWQRVLVNRLLPQVVGHGDREELTMTALGAGTALSTLHTLGRPVIVLHGHKHYPTARLLKATTPGDSDVLVTSAGSCGKAQDWSSADLDDAPRLWPSVNLLELDGPRVTVHAQAWSPLEPTRRNTARRLVSVTREGRRWHPVETASPRDFEPVLALNEARLVLTTGPVLDRHDLVVQRRLEATDAAQMTEYWDVVEGPPGAKVTDVVSGGVACPDAKCPARVDVPLKGSASWRLVGGVLASRSHATEVRGTDTCFGVVSLHNRTRATLARLTLERGPVRTRPFASATDLTTGIERPWPLQRNNGTVVLEYPGCPSRTLLRIYWPLP